MGYLIPSISYSQKSLQFKRSGSPHQLWAACCFARSVEISGSSKLQVLLVPEPGCRCWLHPMVGWSELQLNLILSLPLPLFPILHVTLEEETPIGRKVSASGLLNCRINYKLLQLGSLNAIQEERILNIKLTEANQWCVLLQFHHTFLRSDRIQKRKASGALWFDEQPPVLPDVQILRLLYLSSWYSAIQSLQPAIR